MIRAEPRSNPYRANDCRTWALLDPLVLEVACHRKDTRKDTRKDGGVESER